MPLNKRKPNKKETRTTLKIDEIILENENSSNRWKFQAIKSK